MGAISKESILSIINEQLASTEIDEMPMRPYDPETGALKEHPSWTNPIKLPEPAVFNLNDFVTRPKFKIGSINPEAISKNREDDVKFRKASKDEILDDVAICHSYRLNKFDKRKKLYIFKNYSYSAPIIDSDGTKRYKHLENFIYVNDEQPNVPQAVFPQLPRNRFFDTPYTGAETPKTSEGYSKKYLHFDRINALFTRQDIRTHLIKCAIPPIMAYYKSDIPSTMRIKNQHHYTAPDYNFLLSGLWEDENVQAVLDKIIEYRVAVEMGDVTPEVATPKHMPRDPSREYVYRRGHWDQGQKVEKKEAERTDRLKLLKKAITGGKASIVIVSNLQIQGRLDNRDMTMSATFSVFAKNTPASEDAETKMINPINNILATIRVTVPDDVRIDRLDDAEGEVHTSIELQKGGKKSNEYMFLTRVYDGLMNNLGAKILEIDSDTAIDKYTTFNPADVEAQIDEVRRPKIKITESQLQTQLKKMKAKPKMIVTESQLKTLLKKMNVKPKIIVTEAQLKEYLKQK